LYIHFKGGVAHSELIYIYIISYHYNNIISLYNRTLCEGNRTHRFKFINNKICIFFLLTLTSIQYFLVDRSMKIKNKLRSVTEICITMRSTQKTACTLYILGIIFNIYFFYYNIITHTYMYNIIYKSMYKNPNNNIKTAKTRT